jgi:hypothetical protein
VALSFNFLPVDSKKEKSSRSLKNPLFNKITHFKASRKLSTEKPHLSKLIPFSSGFYAINAEFDSK